jgi:hypothetical protein
VEEEKSRLSGGRQGTSVNTELNLWVLGKSHESLKNDFQTDEDIQLPDSVPYCVYNINILYEITRCQT